jgi:TIR domain-containing protein
LDETSEVDGLDFLQHHYVGVERLISAPVGAMPRITISYRRNDSLDITGRIYGRLARHFGREAVFRDIDDIPPGADFRGHIGRVLDESDIVLVIVGPGWIGPDNERRRLASPADPVRIEIETALRKDKPLIPVLVSRAVMRIQRRCPTVFTISSTATQSRSIAARISTFMSAV